MLTYSVLQVTPFAQNCRIFANTDSREAFVTDPGGSANRIYDFILKSGFELKAIVLTHLHLDHVGGVGELLKLRNVPVLGPGFGDQGMMKNLRSQAIMLGLPPIEAFETSFLADGSIIEPIKGCKLQVIATPGHTPGGVCYYCKEEKLLISGDTLFCGSIGRTDFPGGSYDSIIDSIKEKLLILPEDTVVLPGHGPDSTIGEEKRHNPFL